VCQQCAKKCEKIGTTGEQRQWFNFRGEHSVFQQATVVGWNQFIVSWRKGSHYYEKIYIYFYIMWLNKSSYKCSNVSVHIEPVDVFTVYKYRILFFSATYCHTALRCSKQDFWYAETQHIVVVSLLTFWRLSLKQLACKQTQNAWFDYEMQTFPLIFTFCATKIYKYYFSGKWKSFF
jgi:hypothetical protein